MAESLPSDPKPASKEFVSKLSKTTLAELRAAQGHAEGTRAALVRFLQRGIAAGFSLEQCIRLLAFEPCQAGSLLRRIGYSDHEYYRLVAMLRELPLRDVLEG